MLGRLGRYEIERVIGTGGMGIVLRGFDTELHRPVAIKVLAPHLAHSGPARQRFAREARAAASIVHEHVVAIHDVQSDQHPPYLVMPYVPGQSLQERVDREGSLAATEILRIGIQAAAGLAAAHEQGVIHRDVKPANILLENGIERVMLTDFGLARAADDATLTHSGIVAGTPHYMSPEQARGGSVDVRSDLFSLGAVLYFMATGHPPFRAEQAMAILLRICNDQHRPVQAVNASIPNALADVIDRLLEKKPGRRFATASEAQQSLTRALVRIQQRPRWYGRRWLRRLDRKHWQLVAPVCLVLSVAGLGWLAHWGNSKPDVRIADDSQLTQDLMQELQDKDVAQSSEFAAIDNDLEQLENAVYGNSQFVFSAGDFWQSELQATDLEVTDFERRWSAASPLNSAKGEVP